MRIAALLLFCVVVICACHGGVRSREHTTAYSADASGSDTNTGMHDTLQQTLQNKDGNNKYDIDSIVIKYVLRLDCDGPNFSCDVFDKPYAANTIILKPADKRIKDIVHLYEAFTDVGFSKTGFSAYMPIHLDNYNKNKLVFSCCTGNPAIMVSDKENLQRNDTLLGYLIKIVNSNTQQAQKNNNLIVGGYIVKEQK